MSESPRYPPFARGEDARNHGSNGGKKARAADKTVKTLAEIAQELLQSPCTGETVLKALEDAGFQTVRTKRTRKLSHAVASTANIIRIAESQDEKTAAAAVNAYRLLAELEQRRLELETGRKVQAGGVVLLPTVDGSGDGSGDGA